MMTRTETSVMATHWSHDPAARRKRFDDLCTPHRPALLRYSRWLTRDRDTAEDVVQAALLRAWSNIHTLVDKSAARAWLITITRREMARFHARKRPTTEDIGMLSSEDELAISCPAPEDVDLRGALRFLHERDRDLLLQITDGYTVTEIAEREECRPGIVSVRLFRARKRLRAIL